MKPSECLKKLLDKKNLDTGMGICTNFKSTYGDSLSTVMKEHDISFKDWPLYSGDAAFPVPHGSNLPNEVDFTASYAYMSSIMFNKWNKRTKYGRNRYKLLVWLIEQFELKGA